MPRNPTTGVYTITSNSFAPSPVLGEVIDPTAAHTTWSDLEDGITGSASAATSPTDNAVVRFDGTTGVFIQNSGVIVDDSNNVTGVATLNKVTITQPATGATLTIADGKTMTASKSITLAGTDGKSLTLTNGLTVSGNDGTLAFGAASKTLTTNNTITLAAGADGQTFTFPSSTDTVVTLAASQTLTNKTLTSPALSGTVSGSVTLSGNNTYSGTANHTGNVTVTSANFGLTGNISAPAWTTSGVRYKNVAATLTDTTSSGTVATAYTDVWGGNTIAASSLTTFTNYFGSYFSAPTAGSNVTLSNPWAIGADSAKIGTSNQVTITAAGVVTVPGTLNASGTFQIGGASVTTTASTTQYAAVKIDNTTIQINGSGQLTAVGAAASSVTIGTTTISGGTNKGLIYDNAGVLGNLATGNSGVLVTDGSGVPSIATGGQIPGTSTNNSASAGNIGEYVESVIGSGSAISLTNATQTNLTSISLTAGDWDVELAANFPGNVATTVGGVIGSISTTSATKDLTNGRTNESFLNNTAPFGGVDYVCAHVGARRFSLSSTTTIYGVVQGNFGTNTLSCYGLLRARRVR